MTSPGREYGAALVLLAAGAALALWGLGQPWVSASAGGGEVPMVTAAVSGRSLVPAAAGLAVLLLAGVAGVVATRGLGRRVLAAALVVAALGGAALCVGAGTGLPGSAAGQLTEALAASAESVQVGSWWLAAVGGFALAALGAAGAALRGGRWPSMGGRYERGTPGGPGTRERTSVPPEGAGLNSAHLWDALDRGEDPTAAPEVPQ